MVILIILGTWQPLTKYLKMRTALVLIYLFYKNLMRTQICLQTLVLHFLQLVYYLQVIQVRCPIGHMKRIQLL
ncbi:hypothetical protein GLOIN_2v1582360 [Rhizophagus irregularis DAOM 181602=DAOM 197198]|uniref:Uncharacterized protein n=1 Tax=Rhizophagus irregularis (strain DAOM 181602 / DAOM 197198 / MUCL 43194) TaxID=747089 RepID=A0A2P4Q7Z1_RHIID|nr:hypothetical protein GLOIN_2v1582360 [Rhizophagus irregularis DAOM 181602=DAOM 197198]POG73750.1 hypothetical protein GLOIN_2v1582360 [Rhizophagus irregularis DAOM 181602=DAOM 197198]|eukprot:XP_025180616.1 hypothetical protein GLOIN_2v1582360 [Rhizophagus irregularis DAOM 181602=DAOM 197198]